MNNYSALPDREEISTAWIEAARLLRSIKGRATYNLIYSITEPSALTSRDANIIGKFDDFALQNGISTTTTVANTIFPLEVYLSGGLIGLFYTYDADVFPKVKTAWGNYFDRMTRRRNAAGTPMTHDGVVINPLKTLVEKLKKRVNTSSGSKNHYEIALDDEAYELSTYLPERDRNYPRGGPCLSHVSIKLDAGNKIRLTAFYRSHYYLEKALGNLIGLARLQTFIASEVGASVGPLTCIASSAVLEDSLPNLKRQGVEHFLNSILA